MKISSVFENNEAIPTEYTCDGEDKAPELKIEDVPKNAESLALIADDPDAPAGTWVHWVVWNIPADTEVIKEGVGIQGKNDFGKMGYGGPCPPSGTHRYFFKVYALDSMLDIAEGSTKSDLENAMRGKIIGEAALIGTYSR